MLGLKFKEQGNSNSTYSKLGNGYPKLIDSYLLVGVSVNYYVSINGGQIGG